jgi:hypothetical protein
LREINFLGAVPESLSSSRYGYRESIPPPLSGGGGRETLGELRLRVLGSLPQTHQRYLIGEVRKLCRDYLRANRVPDTEISEEELLSEIWQKLLGTVSWSNDEGMGVPAENDWSTNPHAPEHDGRVVWLIGEIGGFAAMAHRREDVLRERFGKAKPGIGRPIVQPDSDEDLHGIESDQIEGHPFRDIDARRVWRGLLAMASHEFGSEEDVTKLLQIMVTAPDLFEDSSRSQWPVRRIVALLNHHFPPPDWRDRRVEDARRRLTNWINRLMRKNGLDATDLEALFASVARQLEQGDCEPRVEAPSANLPS